MDRFEALDAIKIAWNDSDTDLGYKIMEISKAFYSTGLDLAATAAYIKATPTELASLLALSALDEEIIRLISEIDPPKTTWTIIANASPEEIEQALNALKENKAKDPGKRVDCALSAFVYQKMIEISGPPSEQKVAGLSGDILKHALKKGDDFNSLSEWEKKFLKSVANQKKMGKVLSDKQAKKLKDILGSLVDKDVIKRDSIDGDQDICDEILDALER